MIPKKGAQHKTERPHRGSQEESMMQLKSRANLSAQFIIFRKRRVKADKVTNQQILQNASSADISKPFQRDPCSHARCNEGWRELAP